MLQNKLVEGDGVKKCKKGRDSITSQNHITISHMQEASYHKILSHCAPHRVVLDSNNTINLRCWFSSSSSNGSSSI